MSQKVIQTLHYSLSQLEQAIEETKRTVSRLSTPKTDVLARLDCYQEVLAKQRSLVKGIEQSITTKNWQQVSRLVELIKGSSLLIQVDTQAMIAEIISGKKPAEAEYYQ